MRLEKSVYKRVYMTLRRHSSCIKSFTTTPPPPAKGYTRHYVGIHHVSNPSPQPGGGPCINIMDLTNAVTLVSLSLSKLSECVLFKNLKTH